jgi:hypothetical protein
VLELLPFGNGNIGQEGKAEGNFKGRCVKGITCGVLWPKAAQDTKASVECACVTSEHAIQHVSQQIHVY